MRSLQEEITVFRIPAPRRNFRAGWEVLADEMTAYFGKSCYWLFYRKEEWKIRNAYRICQGKGIKSLNYLLGILKKL